MIQFSNWDATEGMTGRSEIEKADSDDVNRRQRRKSNAEMIGGAGVAGVGAGALPSANRWAKGMKSMSREMKHSPGYRGPSKVVRAIGESPRAAAVAGIAGGGALAYRGIKRRSAFDRTESE